MRFYGRALIVVFAVATTIFFYSCSAPSYKENATPSNIKDAALSPDERLIAFSAIGASGASDVWVVGINGDGLKRLTRRDKCPVNFISRFLKRHGFKYYFRVDAHSPGWTEDGKVVFYEEVRRYHPAGVRTLAISPRIIDPNGGREYKQKAPNTAGGALSSVYDPINRKQTMLRSERFNRTIILKDGILWMETPAGRRRLI